jgi:AcrR family transcriptional regulator
MEQLFETAVALAEEGRTMRKGIPKPLDLALFTREFEQEVQAAFPPLWLQRLALAPLARLAKRHGYATRYGVGEVVTDAGRDDDHRAGAGDDPLPSQPEAHRALDDLEALLLQRVAVQATRHAGIRRQFEVDRDELAVRSRGGLAEGDPLAARGVLECLSWVCHHEQRRRELAGAVWRVIRRNGVDGASVRTVAQEAGWSAGALRHYFRTQSELLDFAIELAAERIRQRVGALELADDPRRAVEQLLSELLPLDDERRAENEVWLAFTAQALIDPQLRLRRAELDDALRAASLRAVELLGLPPGRERGLEAERLHALLDGLALHAAMRPERLPPRRILAVLRRHLDELEDKASPSPGS